MSRKAVFFDIDQTLWDEKNNIEPSTIEAIRELRKNGHMAFICTGRAKGYVTNEKLLGIGFDGIVAGCGTHVELGEGNMVYYKTIGKELAEYTINTVRDYKIMPILEGRDYLYFDFEEFGENAYVSKVKRELGKNYRRIDEYWGEWEFSKLSCDTSIGDTKKCFEALKEYYTYLVHNPTVAEFVPHGHSKATGMEKMCRAVGISPLDSVAFGDSVNDLEMLRFAGVGVAMGNGSEDAKNAADYVTTPMKEAGIYNGLKYLNLI